MTDTPSGWLSVDDAAVAYDVSARTLRRRLVAMQEQGQAIKVRGEHGLEWRVAPPAGQPGHVEPLPNSSQGPTFTGRAALDLIRISDVERLLAPLVTERDELRTQIERLQDARLEDAQQIGRLQQQVEGLREQLTSPQQVQPSSPSTLAVDPSPPRRRWRWPWQR